MTLGTDSFHLQSPYSVEMPLPIASQNATTIGQQFAKDQLIQFGYFVRSQFHL